MVWLALLLPLVWACYLRAPRGTLVGLLAISVVFELSARTLLLGVHTGAYFDAMSPLRAAAAVAAGIWVAEVGGPAAALNKHRLGIAVAALLSALYLLAYQLDLSSGNRPGFGILYPNFTADTGVWAVGWSLLLTLVLILALDRAHDRYGTSSAVAPGLSGLAQLGKASYHVFLIQLAILGLWPDRHGAVLIAQVILALAIGWLYWATTTGVVPVRRIAKARVARRR